MSAINEFISEINELQKYKELYESQKKDKAKMSNTIYDFMLSEYNNTPYKNRVTKFQRDTCRDCRYEQGCEIVLPDNILHPIISDKECIPAKIGCKHFEWS